MYIDLEIGLELLLEIELGIRLIMNLELGLGLLEEIGLGIRPNDLKHRIGTIRNRIRGTTIRNRIRGTTNSAAPQNNIFYEYIFIEVGLPPLTAPYSKPIPIPPSRPNDFKHIAIDY